MTRSADAPLANLHALVVDAAMPDRFREDVLDGLAGTPKSIPAKHLYDARGSALFERICQLPEYDLTRNELAILDAHLPAIADSLGRDATLVEPGAAGGEKAMRLLQAMDRPRAFVPIEVSPEPLEQAAETVARRFPRVDVFPVCADFTRVRSLPTGVPETDRVLFFPGSTIGNFDVATREALLTRFRGLVCPGGRMILGVDLVKPVSEMLAAYDDRAGVTASFNTNLLHRINRELDGDFDVRGFRYEARWDETLRCVEMGQVSLREQHVCVAGRRFRFAPGEWLRTERSHKFTVEGMHVEARACGFVPVAQWLHEARFCLGLYQAT